MQLPYSICYVTSIQCLNQAHSTVILWPCAMSERIYSNGHCHIVVPLSQYLYCIARSMRFVAHNDWSSGQFFGTHGDRDTRTTVRRYSISGGGGGGERCMISLHAKGRDTSLARTAWFCWGSSLWARWITFNLTSYIKVVVLSPYSTRLRMCTCMHNCTRHRDQCQSMQLWQVHAFLSW